MYDADVLSLDDLISVEAEHAFAGFSVAEKPHYDVFKRVLDIASALALMPIAFCVAAILIVLNPFFNKGSLIYRQSRMGKDCVPFIAYKFRTMADAAGKNRGAFDALEECRITKLGRILRKLHADELPQAINILIGDMSLIGPRPDFIEHARVYIECIPGYRARHTVRPGVTGLAQTEIGYVSDEAGYHRQVAADLAYIRKIGLGSDLVIMMRTVKIIVLGRGR